MPDIDLLFQAISLFRRRQFEKCVELTTRALEKNPSDQVKSFYSFSKISFEILGRMAAQNACINRTIIC
jgi:hypothetical protein